MSITLICRSQPNKTIKGTSSNYDEHSSEDKEYGDTFIYVCIKITTSFTATIVTMMTVMAKNTNTNTGMSGFFQRCLLSGALVEKK